MFASSRAVAALCLVTGLAFSSTANAHPSVSSGPAFANKSQKITFGLSHGCSGADTLKVRIDIPAGISSVRALYSDFGKPTFTKNGTAITSVTWTKSDADLLDEDLAFHELTIRARVADVPFTRIQFNVTQTCRSAAGVETIVAWNQPPGAAGDPAPLLTVVPARQAGWNKFVIGATGVAAADLPTYFADALIVWRGGAAYSANANTAALAAATSGVTALASDLVTNDEIWVKY